MYTVFVKGTRYPYKDINEKDAYLIATQVLNEMMYETIQNPELFKTRGFSELYNDLITKVEVASQCIKEARKVED